MLHTQNYLSYMTDVRGFSPLSAKQYGQCLCKFDYWLALSRKYDNEQQITALDINEFMSWCHSVSGLQAKTINLHRTAISSYYTYCQRYHCYTCNPAAETMPMREPHKLPQFIVMDDVERVLASIPAQGYGNCLLRAVILTLCHCGLRAQELCDMTPSSISDKYITVTGKGRKTRMVPCSVGCRAAIATLMRERDKAGYGDLPWLFVSKSGAQMTRSALYHMINDAFAAYCGRSLAHPHALRHTFATYALTHGCTLPQISTWLGHVSYATTMRYLSVTDCSSNPFDHFNSL